MSARREIRWKRRASCFPSGAPPRDKGAMKRSGLFSTFVAAVVIGSFAAGVFEPELKAHGGIPEIFSSLRPTGSGKELRPVDTYSEVLHIIQDSYYGEIPNEHELTYHAIRGMLNSLDDPYTRFLNQKEFAQLMEENSSEFEGIGAELENKKTREGYIKITRPIEDGPAARAGLRAGDLGILVDGKPVKEMTTDQAVQIIRGKAGTSVRLTVRQPGETKTRLIKIVRQPV